MCLIYFYCILWELCITKNWNFHAVSTENERENKKDGRNAFLLKTMLERLNEGRWWCKCAADPSSICKECQLWCFLCRSRDNVADTWCQCFSHVDSMLLTLDVNVADTWCQCCRHLVSMLQTYGSNVASTWYQCWRQQIMQSSGKKLNYVKVIVMRCCGKFCTVQSNLGKLKFNTPLKFQLCSFKPSQSSSQSPQKWFT